MSDFNVEENKSIDGISFGFWFAGLLLIIFLIITCTCLFILKFYKENVRENHRRKDAELSIESSMKEAYSVRISPEKSRTGFSSKLDNESSSVDSISMSKEARKQEQMMKKKNEKVCSESEILNSTEVLKDVGSDSREPRLSSFQNSCADKKVIEKITSPQKPTLTTHNESCSDELLKTARSHEFSREKVETTPPVKSEEKSPKSGKKAGAQAELSSQRSEMSQQYQMEAGRTPPSSCNNSKEILKELNKENKEKCSETSVTITSMVKNE